MTTVALAGRLVDLPRTAAVRFPPANVPVVEERLAAYFGDHAVTQLIASAACGADLTALKVATAAKIPRIVVLPFAEDVFRRTSVERGAGWGDLYNAVLADPDTQVVLLNLSPNDETAGYLAATKRIVAEAARLPPIRACIVWEGAARGGVDHSNALAELAEDHHWPIDPISTL